MPLQNVVFLFASVPPESWASDLEGMEVAFVEAPLKDERLESAVEQAWHWQDAQTTVAKHKAHALVSCEVDASLEAMVTFSRALLGSLPKGVSAIFFPDGQQLWSPSGFTEFLTDEESMQFDLWSNVRLFNLGIEDWCVMDTIGNAQFGTTDHLLWCHPSVDPNEAAIFLRELTQYTLDQTGDFNVGDTADGPGGRWIVKRVGPSPTPPQRPIVLWTLKGLRMPEQLAVA